MDHDGGQSALPGQKTVMLFTFYGVVQLPGDGIGAEHRGIQHVGLEQQGELAGVLFNGAEKFIIPGIGILLKYGRGKGGGQLVQEYVAG